MTILLRSYYRKVATVLALSTLLSPSVLALAVENSTAGDGEEVDIFESNPSIAAYEVFIDWRSLQYTLEIKLNGSVTRSL